MTKIKQEIFKIISMSWTKETCYPELQENWNEDDPSLGQCDITSLIINDFCGGKIMRCMVNNTNHYYNLIKENIIDITAIQFQRTIPKYEFKEEITREYLLSNEDIKNRYYKLLKNVKNSFKQYGTIEYKLRDNNNNELISKIPGTLGGNQRLKIYGKFDCPSALYWISKGQYIDNRVFFQDEETAIEAGYRPCARCMKKEYKLWKQNKI